MCGIIGHIKRTGEIDKNEFNSMRDTLTHRGPDAAGTRSFENNSVFLGHRRLSIIDLSEKGKQPMCNEDRSIWLTFNGEIYNYRKLREQLIESGHQFFSKSDSEVLIHGYEEWGTKGLLSRIKGMFAFALWDSNLQELVLVRDRFGIKPLYYYLDKNHLIFASEIKGIVKCSSVNPAIDESSLADFFIYSYVPHPKSIWQNIYKLEPAHFLVFSKRNFEVRNEKYWGLKSSENLIDKTQAIEQTNELIKNSVTDHLVSDVPVGLLLSGGYDSSSVLMHMSAQVENISSYTIGFQDSKKSEHNQASAIAKIFETEHHVRMIDDKINAFDTMTELSRFYDEPFAISSMIPYYYASQLAVPYNKVVMVGDGGDEAFAGYKWHSKIHRYYNTLNARRFVFDVFKDKEEVLIAQYAKSMTGIYNSVVKSDILNHDLTEMIKSRGFWNYKQYYTDLHSPVKTMQNLDVHTFIPEPCLTRADRSSMANSLEIRVPFLDHEIFEFTFSLHESVYFNSAVKKFLVYENLKNSLSPEILNMPKRGFSYQHLDSLFKDEFEELINYGQLKKLGILSDKINTQRLNKLTKFHLLVLELWYQSWSS